MARVRRTTVWGRAALLAVLAGLPLGCGREPPATDLRGEVTLAGKKFEGTIVLTPAGDTTDRTPAQCEVRNGAYQLTLPAGKKTIQLFPAGFGTRADDNTLYVPQPESVDLAAGPQQLDLKVSARPPR